MYLANKIDAKNNNVSAIESILKAPFFLALFIFILAFIPAFNFIIIGSISVYYFNKTDFDFNSFTIKKFIDLIKKK